MDRYDRNAKMNTTQASTEEMTEVSYNLINQHRIFGGKLRALELSSWASNSNVVWQDRPKKRISPVERFKPALTLTLLDEKKNQEKARISMPKFESAPDLVSPGIDMSKDSITLDRPYAKDY